jgi:hypothetical protein
MSQTLKFPHSAAIPREVSFHKESVFVENELVSSNGHKMKLEIRAVDIVI